MDIIPCPQESCQAPAEVLDRWVAPSTAGPVEHIQIQCLHRHHYLMPTPTAGAHVPLSPKNLGASPV